MGAVFRRAGKTSNAHREFLTNENLAKTLPERTREFETAKTELANLKTESEKAGKDFNEASKDYDRETHVREKPRSPKRKSDRRKRGRIWNTRENAKRSLPTS